MVEILPCPFCGKTPDLQGDFGCGLWRISCFNLECVNPKTNKYESKDSAITKWNCRAQPTPPADPLAQCNCHKYTLGTIRWTCSVHGEFQRRCV